MGVCILFLHLYSAVLVFKLSTSILVMRLSACDGTSDMSMSLGDGFYISRNSGTRGGGWVWPKSANSMTVSGLGFRKALGGPFHSSYVFTVGLRKQSSRLVGPPFLPLKAFFAVWMGSCWPRAIEISLTSGCG